MKFRYYNNKTDKDAVFRILNEVGWVSDAKKDTYLNCYQRQTRW